MTRIRLILSTALLLGIGGASACVSDVPIDNDRTASALKPDAGSDDDSKSDDDDDSAAVKDAGKASVKDAGKAPVAVKDAGKTQPSEPSEPGEGNPPATTDAGQTPSTTDPTDPTDPTEPTEPTEPMMSVVAGSATKNKCASDAAQKGTMCAGYFCGVTQEQIAAEMPEDTLCGESATEGACDGKLTVALAKCARQVKSANLLSSNAQNRPRVRDCVFKDQPDLKAKTPTACMDCFLDAAECAGDNCVDACLFNENPECDACRAKNKCDIKVFACAKLPSPF